ncbi:MAG: GGDEF domain-containing protein [Syntrophothermus sp.]
MSIETPGDHFRTLFEYTPISLWEEDFSEIKCFFGDLRTSGVTSLDEYLETHPEEIEKNMRRIRVIRVNRETLKMFGAASEEQLLGGLGRIFQGEMHDHFRAQLIALWNGELEWSGESVNYRLDGEPLHIRLRWRVLPAFESDWKSVSISIENITVLKKAEEYLRYLGTHDVMTELYNRAYFEEALLSLEEDRQDPIAVIVMDLNNLKPTNDRYGHQAGDKLIRRTAEVLRAGTNGVHITARIGGDEFVVLMPGAALREANELIERIQSLVEVNNQFYREPELSLSLGAAISEPGISLEKVISLADNEMYRNKGLYHRRRREDFE